MGGVKLQSWWQGPFRVVDKVGVSSYRLRTPQGAEFDVHADQLKACTWDEPEDPVTTLQFPPVRDVDVFDE